MENNLKETNEEALKEEAKKISIKEGSAYGVMDGFGLKYITPFALELGAKNFHIGLLSSIPSLAGNFSQLFSSRLIEKVPRKKILFWAVFIQALMWIPLIILPIFYFKFKIDISNIPKA